MIARINSLLSLGKSGITSKFLSNDSTLSYNRTYHCFEKKYYSLNFKIDSHSSLNTIDGVFLLDYHDIGKIINRMNCSSDSFDEFDEFEDIINEDESTDTVVNSLSLDFSTESLSTQFLTLFTMLSENIGSINSERGDFIPKLDNLEYCVIFSLTFKVTMIFSYNIVLTIIISYDGKNYIVEEESLFRILTSMSAGILPTDIRSTSDMKPNVEKISSLKASRLLRAEKKLASDALKAESLKQKKLASDALKEETYAKEVELIREEKKIRLEFQMKNNLPGGRDGVWLYDKRHYRAPSPIDWRSLKLASGLDGHIYGRPNGVDPFPELRMYK
jgi:hypothetical protein